MSINPLTEGISHLAHGVSPEEYPRVLIVHMSCINEADQHGVSLRSWFAGWPRERLGQIYSGNDREGEKFCGSTFKLGPDERRWGRIFFKLKRLSTARAASPLIMTELSPDKIGRLPRRALFKHRIGEHILGSGLWEILFRPRLSPKLLDWLYRFQPQVIYCQGYFLSFSWLPVMLHRLLGIPVVFQTGDDWPANLYRDSAVAWGIRPLVDRAMLDIIKTSSFRFASGDLMASEYARRYGVSFEPMMMCDEMSRFRGVTPRRVAPGDKLSVVYTGTLTHCRWRSIAKLCTSASALQDEGLDILVTAFASVIPPEAVNVLRNITNLQILAPPRHEDVPSILKGADMLFLPETLDPVEARDVHLSISTKAHLYMMSERPILAYGSSVAGVIDYARREGWAYVVDQNDDKLLVNALRALLTDEELREKLVRRGTEVALKNHDGGTVRARFMQAIRESISKVHGNAAPGVLSLIEQDS